MNLWTPDRFVPVAPAAMLVFVLGSLVVLSGALGPAPTIRLLAAFGWPLMALVIGFSTLMALWERPGLQERHPRMRRILLTLMGVILLYMIVAVFLVAS